MIWRIVSGFFVALFLFAAAVQYNDPDPVLWIAAYLYPAGLSLAALWQRFYLWPTVGGVLSYLLVGALVFPGFSADWFHNEEFREAGGLWICALWMAVLALRAARAR